MSTKANDPMELSIQYAKQPVEWWECWTSVNILRNILFGMFISNVCLVIRYKLTQKCLKPSVNTLQADLWSCGVLLVFSSFLTKWKMHVMLIIFHKTAAGQTNKNVCFREVKMWGKKSSCIHRIWQPDLTLLRVINCSVGGIKDVCGIW